MRPEYDGGAVMGTGATDLEEDRLDEAVVYLDMANEPAHDSAACCEYRVPAHRMTDQEEKDEVDKEVSGI